MIARVRIPTLTIVAVALLAAFGMIQTAKATVTANNIDSPTTPTIVAPGESVDVTYTFSFNHSDPYYTCISIQDAPAGAIDLGTFFEGNLTAPDTITSTQTVTVPAGTPAGAYDLRVRVGEFDCNSFDVLDVESDVIIVPAGACPPGWDMQLALGPDDPFDKNGDGVICTKPIPNNKGQGNSANRNGAEDVGHVDGHNHKDNNQPFSD